MQTEGRPGILGSVETGIISAYQIEADLILTLSDQLGDRHHFVVQFPGSAIIQREIVYSCIQYVGCDHGIENRIVQIQLVLSKYGEIILEVMPDQDFARERVTQLIQSLI
ncbi:hypothetical protein DSECCO2_587200 [anaerobic digester metagenome]